jgi:predicted Zn-dependent protease with MMP-like domain
MFNFPDEEFEKLMAECLDELPEKYVKGLNNVLITYADEATPEQNAKQHIGHGQVLLGLYEGIPLTKRNAGYQMVIPDRITLFKFPLLRLSPDSADLKQRVKHTLWHEIAHYYGLDHEMIHDIENRWQG